MKSMTTHGRMSALAVLGAALGMAGCAAPGGLRDRPLSLYLPGGVLLINNIGKVNDCKGAADCAHAIRATGVPALPSFDCGLSVDQFTLAAKTVPSLSWTLPADTADVQYRFRSAPGTKLPIGISVFGGEGVFTGGVDPNQQRVFRLVFNSPTRATQAFKYGVYLDYKTPNTEWTACMPLDPVIFSMD